MATLTGHDGQRDDGTGHGAAGEAASEGQAEALRRTGIFVGLGAALLVGGWLAQPRFRTAKVEPEAARVLFPELADAAKAGSLSIVSYDDELATLKPFKVVQADGVWVLPSHDNYPADAREQLAAAATELVDRPILDVVSTSPGDHETYGVIEPDPEKIQPGMTGVGQLVEIRDAAGNRLARLVVGKEDKRPGAGGPAGGRPLRFVRKAGQDPVYRVELDTSKFTTRFEDWIEKDLLRLSPWDVRRVTIDDSTCSFGVDEASGRLRVSQDRRAEIEVSYDDRDAKWSLVRLEGFSDRNEPREEMLGDDEELASAKLNDLRTALGDLKIVDVARKPAGLSGDLKAEESFTGDREAVASLAQRGFFPFQSGDILSSNGQTVVGMKDGVEYLLRFGNGVSVAGAAGGSEPQGDAEEKAGQETTGRYLFVMARFNESLLEKPVLEPLPEVPGVPGDEPPAGGAKAADAAKPVEEKADAAEAKGGAAKPAADAASPKDDAPKPAADSPPAEPAAKEPEGGTPAAAPAEPKPAPAPETTTDDASASADDELDAAGDVDDELTAQDEPAADAQAADTEATPAAKPAADAPAGEAKPAADATPAAGDDAAKPAAPAKPEKAVDAAGKADEAEAKAQQALEERRRVERENRRRQEEYDGKVEAAKKRVRELNSRFADWYYVVSDAEYAKIRLDRGAVVQKKAADPAVPE
jgi:hypothetical protein